MTRVLELLRTEVLYNVEVGSALLIEFYLVIGERKLLQVALLI